ncbi:protein kinase [Streptomyces physcomitrii]|uniref:protein kinase domain-containing protein n=1 Tax=Streptomyces physcomitrii TaxID=2724184 RepID=UPI0033CA20E4
MLSTPEDGDKIVGRYVLQEAIGRGGMGVVWRAWDERLRREVAVKCARLDDPRATQRLITEARNAGRLHHPNIVGVFDFVDQGADCWIVMEYVPSRSLAQLMDDRGPLSPEEAGSIGCQIADALAKSHGEGVVHGDVTPENILVTEDGLARLTDFGISRALWSDATQSVTGGVRGKPRYLAPEVAKGKPAGEKSDVFSLGASLFAAVEGQSPYGEAEHPMAYLARAIEGHREPARRAGPLAEPLAALLAAEPRQRPDAARARRLLGRAAAPPPHVQEQLADRRTVGLPSLTLRLPRAVRRRRRPLALAALALVTAGAVTAGLLLFGPWGSEDGGEGGPTGTAAPATGRPGALGEPRTADPCKLLAAASLSRFGDAALDPDYGEIDRCDVLLRNGSGDEVADVEVNFDADLDTYEGEVSTREVGGLRVTSLPRDGDLCERALATTDHRQIRVRGKRLGSPSPDPCQLADAATDHVLGLLDDGPVPRRTAAPAPDSLARVDACTLLGDDTLTRVPGVDPKSPKNPKNRDPGFGAWSCDWFGDEGPGEVELQFSRDNALEDDGKAVDIGGARGYLAPEEAGEDSCTARLAHRTYRNSAGDRTVELLQLTVYGSGSTKRLCETATSLTSEAARAVADQLPGK